MHWGCFLWYGVGSFIPLYGKITGVLYVETLYQHLLPVFKVFSETS